jgi:diguanylate cyclase (GGDEF)-like protein
MIPSASTERPALDRESHLNLLLIEDSSSDSELIRALLEEELPQAKVDVAWNLEDALVRLSRGRYDATLADLSLPDAEGVAVVRAVRSAHPDTALLVLTGRADGELDLWSLAEGAQDYLVKGADDGPRLATALLHALQRQRAEQEAHQYLQLARGLLDALEAPTCMVDADSSIVAVNEAWRVFTLSNGGDPEACGEGNSYLSACAGVTLDTDPTDIASATEVATALRSVLTGALSRFQYEYSCHAPDQERWFSVRIAHAEIDGAHGAVISHVDVTAMHQVQLALSHQALHDDLTGLPNRLLLLDRLNQALSDCERRGCEVAVVFIDLDHFKRINDSLGHHTGDDLLVQVAHRLGQHMRGADTLSRYSGDEFVVVCRDLASVAEATILSQRFADVMKEPFLLGTTSVNISASLGLAVGRSQQSAENLLLAADAAMYDAKRRGRGRVRVFSDELRRGAEERMVTEVGLRGALTRGELVLHYQPVIDLETGRATAVEALVRWQHPERGLVGPDDFIPVAEASGLVVSLDRWVLAQACSDATAFEGAAAGLDVAVNLSVRQLTQPDVVSHVQEAIATSGLPPERLVLEVTESAVMEDEDAAALALLRLSHLGVRIAIDDFGTGYSSLLYLRRYPVSTLKLDRAFVSGISVSRDDEAICSSVVSLAHAVGATSIAEGVETTEQYAALRDFGCQQAQGFLWSPAVPVAELADVLLACRDVRIPPRNCRTPVVPARLVPAVAAHIANLHRAGASLSTIAASLNRVRTRNPEGPRWTAGAVARHISALSDHAA